MKALSVGVLCCVIGIALAAQGRVSVSRTSVPTGWAMESSEVDPMTPVTFLLALQVHLSVVLDQSAFPSKPPMLF